MLTAGVRTETGHAGFFRLLIAQDIGAKSEISGPGLGAPDAGVVGAEPLGAIMVEGRTTWPKLLSMT